MKLTQKQKVLRHLREIGSITPIDALRDYSIMRLTSRVCELKDEGHNIKSELVSGKNKYGESVRYSKYTLVEQE
ncbi:MAG: hypothetical protein Unbinned92contig1003_32 [Prokaryotic dsDNA virus sp.]|nr:MAG: hypothetical protein Unbinned92contig1003_32 [Prokaryotic dsDNA virus sp.]